jgi:hypothetical protein
LARDRDDEIRLTAEQCRRLQHVYDRGDLVERRAFVNVGEHGQLELGPDSFEDPQAALQAQAAESA